jgi:hypothetical protein
MYRKAPLEKKKKKIHKIYEIKINSMAQALVSFKKYRKLTIE